MSLKFTILLRTYEMPKIEKELYLAEKAVPQKNLHNRLPQSFKGYERMRQFVSKISISMAEPLLVHYVSFDIEQC